MKGKILFRSILSLILLFCFLQPVTLAKSDWEEDNEGTLSTLTPAETKDSDSQNSGDDKNSSSSLRSQEPLQGNVSEWQTNSNRHLGYSNFNFQEILRQAVILPPPIETSISTKTLRGWLATANPSLKERLNTLNKDSIIELKGTWDDSGHILRGLGIPYTRINSNTLAKQSLASTKIIIVNCGCELPLAARRVINKFVSEGGYLLTTDWALDSCLTGCFPGYASWNGGFTEAGVVDAVVMHPQNKFLHNTISPAYWKLEKKSQLVKILSPEVTVLVQSHKLIRCDPIQMGILALTFNYGQGKVLHLVGHFDNNSDRAFNNALADPSPKITISLRQAIATNFVADALLSPGLSANQDNLVSPHN